MLTPMTLNEVLPRAMAILTFGFSAASSYDVDQVKRAIRERAAKRPDRLTVDDVTERIRVIFLGPLRNQCVWVS